MNLPELGPVVWPAYSDTSVGVRSRELADILTNDADARCIIAAGLYGIEDLAVRSDDSDEPTDETTDLESVQESVRSDDDEPTATTSDDQPVVATSRGHRMRIAKILAAKTEIYVLHELNQRKIV